MMSFSKKFLTQALVFMLPFLSLTLISLAALTAPALAEHTRPTNPNAVSLEAFGKSFLYTVQYDRAVTDDVFAGIGIGSVSLDNLDETDANVSAVLVPI